MLPVPSPAPDRERHQQPNPLIYAKAMRSPCKSSSRPTPQFPKPLPSQFQTIHPYSMKIFWNPPCPPLFLYNHCAPLGCGADLTLASKMHLGHVSAEITRRPYVYQKNSEGFSFSEKLRNAHVQWCTCTQATAKPCLDAAWGPFSGSPWVYSGM